MSKTLSASVKFTIFTVITLLATGLLAITIGNLTFTKTVGYHAIFSDAVNLNKGDEVRMAGVRVGSVTGVQLYHGTEARVSFSVDKSLPLYTSTQAVIRYRNLIGQRYLALVDGPGNGRKMATGATIPLARTQPALNLNVLFNGFRPLLTALSPADLNKLSYELVQVLQGEGTTVTSLFEHVGSLTNTLADRDALIGQVIDNLNAVLGPLDARDRQLTALVNNLQQFTSGLASDRQAIGASIAGINDLAATTSDLLTHARPALKNDIQQLGRLVAKLDVGSGHKELKHWLEYTPFKMQVATAITTYGSFQNFYLCAANFILPDGTVTPIHTNHKKRCFNP